MFLLQAWPPPNRNWKKTEKHTSFKEKQKEGGGGGVKCKKPQKSCHRWTQNGPNERGVAKVGGEDRLLDEKLRERGVEGTERKKQ